VLPGRGIAEALAVVIVKFTTVRRKYDRCFAADRTESTDTSGRGSEVSQVPEKPDHSPPLRCLHDTERRTVEEYVERCLRKISRRRVSGMEKVRVVLVKLILSEKSEQRQCFTGRSRGTGGTSSRHTDTQDIARRCGHHGCRDGSALLTRAIVPGERRDR
jgi:hypothetical protein